MNVGTMIPYGDVLFDKCLATPEYEEAKAVVQAYENRQIDASSERWMQARHVADAGFCVPRLALEVLIDGISSIAIAMLIPMAGVVAVVAVAECLGLSIVATVVASGAFSIYGFVTRLVVNSLTTSGPTLVAGGICVAVAIGVLRQLIGYGNLGAARDFRSHLKWAADPLRAARADLEEQRQRCWNRFTTGVTIGVGVAALAVLASFRFGHNVYHNAIRLHGFFGQGF